MKAVSVSRSCDTRDLSVALCFEVLIIELVPSLSKYGLWWLLGLLNALLAIGLAGCH